MISSVAGSPFESDAFKNFNVVYAIENEEKQFYDTCTFARNMEYLRGSIKDARLENLYLV